MFYFNYCNLVNWPRSKIKLSPVKLEAVVVSEANRELVRIRAAVVGLAGRAIQLIVRNLKCSPYFL